MAALRKGNQKSVTDFPEVIDKALNKEERHSHLATFPRWQVRHSWTARTTAQSVNLKNPDKPRVIWDGTSKSEAYENVMNEMTPTSLEPPVTYGHTKLAHIQHIYNTRVSYPSVDILTATDDVSACFRFPRITPDACGAFSFAIRSLFCLTTAMVFGSVIGASSWEPFRRAIEVMAAVFFAQADLPTKYAWLLNMITWEPAPGRALSSTKHIRAL